MSLTIFDGRVNTPKDFTVDMGGPLGGASTPLIYLKSYSTGVTTQHTAVISGETVIATIIPTDNNRGRVVVIGEITYSGDTEPSQSDNGETILIGPQITAS